jgi:glutathione S-transferase
MFYHAPWSRASGILWLLEELGQPYEIERVDIRAPGGVPESYRAIQPNKKVPAIMHDGTVVTERAAICLYLTERFPEAGLAPAIGDKERAAFLSWLIYSDSVFDPVVAARAQGWEYAPNNFSFGAFDDMLRYLEKTLSGRPYIAGETFTAADTQLGAGIHYTTNILRILPEKPVFKAYLDRVTSRPAYQRSVAKDYEMAKAAGMPGTA